MRPPGVHHTGRPRRASMPRARQLDRAVSGEVRLALLDLVNNAGWDELMPFRETDEAFW
jgi:hypothetical protein